MWLNVSHLFTHTITIYYIIFSFERTICILVYSYFEKGCRKKCTRQSRKVLWVILRSLFFKESQDRMAREAMDICLRVLKESNKSRFDSYKVRNRVLIISHITFRDCRVQIFSDNLSRNGCMALSLLSLDKLPKTGYQNADVCKNPIIVTKCEFWNPQPS